MRLPIFSPAYSYYFGFRADLLGHLKIIISSAFDFAPALGGIAGYGVLSAIRAGFEIEDYLRQIRVWVWRRYYIRRCEIQTLTKKIEFLKVS